jgi:diacylglycerol O-acyltransferase
VSDRLTPLDASFLHLEDGSSHMHVGAVLEFEGQPPPYDEFVDFVESRLHLVPRYRQKIAEVPFAQARPRWVDDERFDIRFHVRATGLPSPGDEEQLRTLAARVFSQQLTRERPLWELWLVEGLGRNRFAIVTKTHHALVDGIAGVDLITALFAPEEEGQEQRWQPEPAPSGLGLLAEALLERATAPAELYRFGRSLLRGPGRVVSRAAGFVAGLGAMASAGLSPGPRSPYNRQRVGPDRRLAWVKADLDDFKAIKGELGVTLNDVVLAAVGRALRRHLVRRGEDEVDALRAFVPVSIRSDDRRGDTGNEVAGMIIPLPIACEDPVSCAEQIADRTNRAKQSPQALGAQALTGLSGFAPPTLLDQGARLAWRQRFVNLVVTNVPGPQRPLSLLGKELQHMIPLVPVGANMNLNIAILSYNGGICFGLAGDFDAVPDLDDLAGDLTESIDELADAAGIPTEPEPTKPAPRHITPVT